MFTAGRIYVAPPDCHMLFREPDIIRLQMMAPGKMSDFVGSTTIVSQEVDDNKAHLTAGITERLGRNRQIIGRCSTKPLAHTPQVPGL